MSKDCSMDDSEVKKMAVGSSTDIGAVRKANEDSYLLDEGKKVFAVADGMGGHENGKLASALAIDVFTEIWQGLAR